MFSEIMILKCPSRAIMSNTGSFEGASVETVTRDGKCQNLFVEFSTGIPPVYFTICINDSVQTNSDAVVQCTRRLHIFHLADHSLFFLKDPQFLWHRDQSGALERCTDQHNLRVCQLIREAPLPGHTTARLHVSGTQTDMAAFRLVSALTSLVPGYFG
jgi:hypothetical protein